MLSLIAQRGKKPPVCANPELAAAKGEQKLHQGLARQRHIVSGCIKMLFSVKLLYTDKLQHQKYLDLDD